MIQMTLAQARPALSQVMGTTGMSLSDPRYIQRLNEAQLELMNAVEGLPNVVDRYYFRVNQHTGLVALPSTLDRMISATVDGCPEMIVSPWYEFSSYGPGLQDDFDANGNRMRCWANVITDRGDHPVKVPIPVAGRTDVTGPWTLRVYTSLDEQGAAVYPPNINVQGLDENGLIVRSLSNGTGDTEYMNGVNYPMDVSEPFTTNAQQFSKITGVVKPETNGYIRLTAWNGSVEIELSDYAYNETAPSYRIYYIPWMHNRWNDDANRYRVLLARCHRRFVPVKEDNDLLVISNIMALKCGIIAQWKRDAGNFQDYQIQMGTAINILKQEAMGYLGKSRVPAISFQRGFSIGAMAYLR